MSAVPPEHPSDTPLHPPVLIAAPKYPTAEARRLQVQRTRRHLSGAFASSQFKFVHTELLTELYAPVTDFAILMVYQPGWVPRLGQQGLILSLEEVFPEHDEIFHELALRRVKSDGHLYAAPQLVAVRTLFYRVDLLKKYGIRPPRTWEELIDSANYVVRAERQPTLRGFLSEFRSSVWASLLLEQVWAGGAELFDNAPNWVFNTRASRQALKRLSALQKLGGLSSQVNSATEHWDRYQTFFAGQAVFLHHWSDGIRYIHDLPVEQQRYFGWCRVPSAEGGSRAQPPIGGANFVVPRNTRSPELACRVLRRMLDAAFVARMDIDFGYPFPALLSLYEHNKLMAARPYYARFEEVVDGGRLIEETGYLGGSLTLFQSAVARALRPFFFGSEADFGATVAALEANLSPLLPAQAPRGLSARITALLESGAVTAVDGSSLAKALGYSRAHLAKRFKRETGVSLHTFVTELRVRRAKELFQHTSLNVSEVADQLGFKTVHHFSRVFKQVTGKSPRSYRR